MPTHSPVTVSGGGSTAPGARGLSRCLDEGRIVSASGPLDASGLDVEALRVVEQAADVGRAVVICPPDPLQPFAALIAAGMHVARMAEGYQRGIVAGSDLKVAVVTTDYRARAIYRSLGIRRTRYSPSVGIRNVVPAITVGPAGDAFSLDDTSGAQWATAFCSRVADVERLRDVSAVVVDLPVADAQRALRLELPVVFVARDPADYVVGKLSRHTRVFAWGDDDIARCQNPTPPLAIRQTGMGCVVAGVVSDGVCANAGLFWQDIGPVSQLARRSATARQLARDAFGIFHDLLSLALSLPMFEAYTGATLNVRLRDLAAASRIVRGDLRDLYFPSVEAELRGLLDALGDTPPKHEALRRVLSGHLDDRRSVTLVTRTASLNAAYAAWLRSCGLEDVRVATIARLGEETPTDVGVMTGMAPSWARWLYRSGFAGRIDVLSYTTADGQPGITGFCEATKVRETIAAQRSAAQAFSAGGRTLTDDPDPKGTVDEDPAVPVITIDAPPDEPPGLSPEASWFSATAGERSRFRADDDSMVDAREVTFNDGRWALFRAGGTVTRWRPRSEAVDEAHPVDRVSAGDQLVLVDGDGHKHLMEKMLEVAESVPSLAVAAEWVGHWRQVLHSAYQTAGSHAELHRQLRSRGCTVQAQTVRLWVIGETLGPDDPQDIVRLGQLTDDVALKTQHHRIADALHSLRGAHVRLGQRVARLARRVGPGAIGHDPDELLDERSGLTAADFAHAVEVLTVASVGALHIVPATLTGRIYEPEDEL